MDFNTQRAAYLDRIAAALTRAFAEWSAPAAAPENRVEDASAYALLGGGKRLRAMLALAAGEALEVLTPGGGGYGRPVCVQRNEAKRPSL